MIVKRLLRPERVRRTPPQFSWVDHRLVRDHHLERCGPEALALYLFLVIVGDAEGLSYYSEASIARSLSMDAATVRSARAELIQADLLAYRHPLYQVLSIDPLPVRVSSSRSNECVSLSQILQRAMGGQG
jgi:hypothetical protein